MTVAAFVALLVGVPALSAWRIVRSDRTWRNSDPNVRRFR